jgi:hypothetical protein
LRRERHPATPLPSSRRRDRCPNRHRRAPTRIGLKSRDSPAHRR